MLAWGGPVPGARVARPSGPTRLRLPAPALDDYAAWQRRQRGAGGGEQRRWANQLARVQGTAVQSGHQPRRRSRSRSRSLLSAFCCSSPKLKPSPAAASIFFSFFFSSASTQCVQPRDARLPGEGSQEAARSDIKIAFYPLPHRSAFIPLVGGDVSKVKMRVL